MPRALLLAVSLLISIQDPVTLPLTIPPAVTRLVVVDAFVADGKGLPITGLRAEDFELFEDNRPVSIEGFETASDATLVVPAAPAAGVAAAGNPATGSGESVTIAIYVDRRLLSPFGRKRALDQAANLAAGQMAKGASAVVIADDEGLRSLTPLTRDPAVIRAELERLQGWATTSPGLTEGRSTIDNIRARIETVPPLECPDQPPCVCVLPELITMVRIYARSRATEANEAAERLTFLANALGSVPGRKALIYVSDGLEQRPGIHLYDQLGSICPQAMEKEFGTIAAAMQEFETSAALREATARANAARVTFYPLDARGLQAPSTADISQERRETTPGFRSDSIRDANQNNPLELLAEETGGFPLLRGLDAGTALKRFEADARGHYVFGFAPGEPDGRTHSLSVKLSTKAAAGRKVSIRHRQSYLRAVLPDRRGQRALSALLFGLEENDLGIEAEVERSAAEMAEVRVVLLLPTLKAASGETRARLKLVISYRKNGDAKSAPIVREKDVDFDLSPASLELEGGLREVIVAVPVAADGHEFVIALEDLASGRSSYLKRTLSPSEGDR